MEQNKSSQSEGPTRFEGYELPALLTAEDIATIVGFVSRRTVVQWFASGRLRGRKLGKRWVMTSSAFVAEWEILGQWDPRAARLDRLRRTSSLPVDSPRALRKRAA